MKRYLILLLLCCLAISLSATGSAEIHAKMQGAYKSLSSFQANVSQTNYYPQLKRSIVYDGRIYFSPGRMLMSFDKPHTQLLKIENSRVELYDAQSNTLFKAQMLPQFGKMNPVEILQLYWTKSTVKIIRESGDIVSVKLIPKDDPLIISLNASINKKSGLVQSLSYSDSSGNTVTYAFSGIKTNAAIPSGVWSFSYPKDAQIIEQ
ncbi:MAG: outer membrane lipoprotein carrier protein LolA [Candidatus Cloacimonadaceae bacterium]|nr:outer membrane lipoprotein carrier protein LolA [Candidatus Cloacimonadaceae bacterium]